LSRTGSDSVLPVVIRVPNLWYEKTRLLDVNGDGRPDTVRLRALGHRADSLAITLSFLSGRDELYKTEWYSGYELVDPPLPKNPPTAVLDSFVRHRLDRVLADIELSPFDTTSLNKPWDKTTQCAGDPGAGLLSCIIGEAMQEETAHVDWSKVPATAAIARLDSTHALPFDTAEVIAIGTEMNARRLPNVTISYGYETTMILAWSERKHRFYVVESCC
jgi:hypothetical protein